MRVLLLLFLLGPIWWPAQAQTFRRISIEQGLSQSSVYAILQDRQGFMWFGTQDGLNRYDGHEFVIFPKARDQQPGLTDKWVRVLLEGMDGTLWIGTNSGGLNSYNPETGNFTHFDGLANQRITAMILSDDLLWIGTTAGLYRLQNNRFHHYPLPTEGTATPQVLSLAKVDGDHLWVGTSEGLFMFDIQEDQFRGTEHAGIKVNTIFNDEGGTYWFGSLVGVRGIGADHKLRRPFEDHGLQQRSAPEVNAVLQDPTGNYLFATSNAGLYYYDGKREPRRIAYDPERPEATAGLTIHCLYQDRLGNTWMGTHGNGVYRSEKKDERFKTIRRNPNRKGLMDNIILSFHEDQSGDIWVGTVRGLHRLSADGERVQAFPGIPLKGGGVVADAAIMSIIRADENQLWLGMFREGLYRYHTDNGEAIRYAVGEEQGQPSQNIRSLYQDPNGTLWVGTDDRGLFQFKGNMQTSTRYARELGGPLHLSHNFVRVLYRCPAGNLWVGTDGGGLNRWEKGRSSFQIFAHDSERSSSLSDNSVNCIASDDEGTLWVGTNDGLNRYLGEERGFDRFFERDGLPNSVIYAVVTDPSGDIWVSTNMGLSCFNPRKQVFRNFDIRDGLQSNEFNTNVSLRSRAGTIYFGGVNGLNMFRPENLNRRSPPPPMVFTSIQVLGKPLLAEKTPSYLQHLRLNHWEDLLTIQFAALDYDSNHQFACRMEGLHQDWINLGQRRFMTYANLEPGDYTLQVRTSRGDGFWHPDPLTMTVSVIPPWWQNPWVRLGFGLLVVAMLWFLYRLRVARLLEIERLRARIAQDLHDDVGASLTNITVLAELVRGGHDKKGNKGYLEQIENMSRNLVDTMSDIVWSVNNRYDRMEDLVTRMREFAAGLPDHLDFSFSAKMVDPRRKLLPAVRHHVYLIFKEAVGNSIKHANPSRIAVTLHRHENTLSLFIADDGPGLPENSERRGNGLRNMVTRAEEINGTLKLENHNGLVVSLEVPLA